MLNKLIVGVEFPSREVAAKADMIQAQHFCSLCDLRRRLRNVDQVDRWRWIYKKSNSGLCHLTRSIQNIEFQSRKVAAKAANYDGFSPTALRVFATVGGLTAPSGYQRVFTGRNCSEIEKIHHNCRPNRGCRLRSQDRENVVAWREHMQKEIIKLYGMTGTFLTTDVR